MKVVFQITFALLIASILFIKFQKRFNTKQNWLLIASLLLSDTYLLTTDFIVANINNNNLYLSLASNFCILLFLPCSYLYTRAIILQQNVKLTDIKHALPAFVYLTNYILIFFVARGKNSAISGIQGGGIPNSNSYYNDFFGPGIAYISFCSHIAIIYLLLQINTVFNGLKTISPQVIKQNVYAIKWVLLYGMMQSFFFYYWLSGSHVKGTVEIYLLQVFVIISSIVIVGLFIVKYLNTYLEQNTHEESIPSYEDIDPNTVLEQAPAHQIDRIPELTVHHSITFQDHELVHLEEKIQTTMVEKQLFLNHRFTVRMLSEETDIQPHVLSAYINQQHGMNFNYFINDYRIKFCIEKIKNGEWKYKTLEALCKESGFNNRNSFTLSFKKVTGLTPSEFLKQPNIHDIIPT